jgi:hypothetical protein
MKRLILLLLLIALPSYAMMSVTMIGGGGTSTPECTAQTITWNTQPAAMTVGDSDQTLNQATSDSSLTITYTTNNSAICTIVSSKLHAVGEGLCVVSANQAGNVTYCAASQSNSGNVAISAVASVCTIGSGANYVNTTNDDWWPISTTITGNKQYVVIAGPTSFCRVDLYIERVSDDTITMKICDTDCSTNCTQADSTVNTTSGTNWYQFNWATAVTKTTDLAVCWAGASASVSRSRVSNSATYFGVSTSGKNVTLSGTGHDQDANMKLYYLQ